MTFEPPAGPRPELSTTRVAGGTSARVVAMAVAGLLIGVVGFTVVNRPAPPVASLPTSAPVAIVLTPAPAPTPTPPRNQLEGNDGIFGWPVVAQLSHFGGTQQVPARVYEYAASMPIIGGLLRAPLLSHIQDDYNGSVDLESTDLGPTVQIDVGRQWSEQGLYIFETFDSWNVALKPLRRSRGGQVTLLVAHVPPRLTRLNGPGPTADGYTFTVLGWRDGSRLTLMMDLVWPVGYQAVTYSGPRDPALYNRCRWDVGPLAAPPRPGTNEADC